LAQSIPYLKNRRLRLIGGPNGSGKSTIIYELGKKYDIGIYLNPDDIGHELAESGKYNIGPLSLKEDNPNKFARFVKSHSLTEKASKDGYPIELALREGYIIPEVRDRYTYEAALIADYLRKELIKVGKKMTFESVMSHPSKIDILKEARTRGYKTYLYYVCTASPTINIERVNLRVKKGGHDVPNEKIEERYYKSLALLKEAAKRTYRTFIWDNSGAKPELILEIFEGREITFLTKKAPHWVKEYLL